MKFLKIVLAVLTIVTLLEFGYFVKLKYPQEKNKEQFTETAVKSTPSEDKVNNLGNNGDNSTPEKLISGEVINNLTNYLNTRTKNKAQIFKVREEIDGLIGKVEISDKQTEILITDNEGKKVVSLFYSVDTATRRVILNNFFKVVNGAKIGIKETSEIKSGQKIKRVVDRNLIDNTQSLEENLIYEN